MPLSKARDKARKKKERAKIRLDKLLSSLGESKCVQPNIDPSTRLSYGRVSVIPNVDADGNPMPKYT